MTSKELLKEIESWLSFNTEPSKEETAKLRKSIKDHLAEQLTIPDVNNRRELYFDFMEEYNSLMGESEHQILKEEVEVLLANKHSGDMEKIDQIELKAQFTEEFFEEFQFDAEFRSIFESMARGLTPYEAIEHLCKSKKELFKSLERAIENTPQRIIISPERFEQLKGEIEQ